MDNPEKLYMLFTAGGMLFLAPFLWLKSVGEEVPEDNEVINFAHLTEEEMCKCERPYFISLAYDERPSFTVRADEVMGICEVPDEDILELPGLILHDCNRYLKGAVYREIPSYGFRIAYIIDPETIMEQEAR